MKNIDLKNSARRRFLRSVPVAAAAGLALTDVSLLSSLAAAQSAAPTGEGKYDVIRAQELADDMQSLQGGGNKTLYQDRNFSFVLTTEKTASAKEFEWHEGRDHILNVIQGSTTYELGGIPQNAHSKGPGEWLAPASEGAAKVTLSKGDTLVIPRGTPHKRSTPESVTFTLTSPMTPGS